MVEPARKRPAKARTRRTPPKPVEPSPKAARKGARQDEFRLPAFQVGKMSARTLTCPVPPEAKRLCQALLLSPKLIRNPRRPQGLPGFFVFILNSPPCF